MNKYLRYETTKDQPRSDWSSAEIIDNKLKDIVKSVNNRAGISQRKIGRHFHVYHSTISRNFPNRTSIRIRKRGTAPKMDSEDQGKRIVENSIVNCCLVVI